MRTRHELGIVEGVSLDGEEIQIRLDDGGLPLTDRPGELSPEE
ncbi:MAG: hypothetical protein R6U88_06495 [Candidatus Bipolaricaulota bacterium]